MAQSFPDAEVDSVLKTGINEIWSHNYDEAVKVFSELDKDKPGLPFGKIYQAVALMMMQNDLNIKSELCLCNPYWGGSFLKFVCYQNISAPWKK